MTARLGLPGTGQADQPTRWASLVVRTAALPLPSEHRWRYRQEFLSELYGMTPTEQRHHASGVLSRIWTLRLALTEPERLTHKGGHDGQTLAMPTSTAPLANPERRSGPAVPGVPRLRRRDWRRPDDAARWRVQ